MIDGLTVYLRWLLTNSTRSESGTCAPGGTRWDLTTGGEPEVAGHWVSIVVLSLGFVKVDKLAMGSKVFQCVNKEDKRKGAYRDVKLTSWVGVYTVVAFVGVWSILCAELLVEPLPLFGIEETRKATAKMVKARRTTTQANMRQLYSPRKARRCWLLKGMMMV